MDLVRAKLVTVQVGPLLCQSLTLMWPRALGILQLTALRDGRIYHVAGSCFEAPLEVGLMHIGLFEDVPE